MLDAQGGGNALRDERAEVVALEEPAVSFSSALTVAVQVPRSTSAISPNTLPAASRATVSFSPPGMTTVASAAPLCRT